MAWFKVDDKFHSHPKVIGLPLRALGLWVKAGAWCSDQLTDGKVPRAALTVLGGSPSDAGQLVNVGLWVVDGNGWRFHDWLDMQPSRADVEAGRAAEREKKQRWREKARKDPQSGQFQPANLRAVGGES